MMSPTGEQALRTIAASGADRRPLGERGAATPRLACRALCQAINAGDLDAALESFSPGAALLNREGPLAQGEAAIAASLRRLIDSGAQLEIELAGVIAAADLALAYECWATRTEEAGRSLFAAFSAAPTMVLRLIDGEWKVAIAAPWGVPAKEAVRAIWP